MWGGGLPRRQLRRLRRQQLLFSRLWAPSNYILDANDDVFTEGHERITGKHVVIYLLPCRLSMEKILFVLNYSGKRTKNPRPKRKKPCSKPSMCFFCLEPSLFREANLPNIWDNLFKVFFVQNFSGWWFQPIWKILVKLDHFPGRGENKNIWNHHLVFNKRMKRPLVHQPGGHEEQASNAFVHQPCFGETNNTSSLDFRWFQSKLPWSIG